MSQLVFERELQSLPFFNNSEHPLVLALSIGTSWSQRHRIEMRYMTVVFH
jgi:hypothetical protein